MSIIKQSELNTYSWGDDYNGDNSWITDEVIQDYLNDLY